MFYWILGVLIATTFSMSPMVASAQGYVKIAANPGPKLKKDMTTEEYYTSVKLDAAKAYGESLALQKQGKWLEASRYLRKCLLIRNYFVDTDKEIPVYKQKLGEVLVKAGKSEEALQMFGEAIGGFARWYGPGCSQSISPLTSTGDIYMARQNPTKALTCYSPAYAMSQRNTGVNSPECMNLRLKVAAANKATMQFEPAAVLYAEALDRQKKNEKLIDSERLYSTLQDYATVLKELKKDDEAQKILERANAIHPSPVKESAPAVSQPNSSEKPTTSK